MENIAAVSEENSASTEEVSATVEEVTAQVEEVTASAQNLSAMAEELQALVAQFTLPAEMRVDVPLPLHAAPATVPVATPAGDNGGGRVREEL